MQGFNNQSLTISQCRGMSRNGPSYQHWRSPPPPEQVLNYIQSQSIEIISSTVSWPILNGKRKPIHSRLPDMWCDSGRGGQEWTEW